MGLFRLFCLVLMMLWLNLSSAWAEDLLVGKSCPVSFQNQPLGILVFSKEWYHNGRERASYTPYDNATGVGIEIHFLSNQAGGLKQQNVARCDRYRLLQIRRSNLRLSEDEQPMQIDVPHQFEEPFYDHAPLEHGYGTHASPIDINDKPWPIRPMRASTVALYDTPYASDHYGKEGEPINVMFETCVVCQREDQYDNLLACGSWGYQRDYMGGYVGWSEPEFIHPQCLSQPSHNFKHTLDQQQMVDYRYWLDWR
ncbi:hypothetical protein K6Y31_12815 [Motilimonas cestriensis]|uniref:Secreted protein n=1 Tax=Motilimonas cestriensis TaxID=2742685 RepID=A0ABS8W9K6_9GAMM|nr:hypothetical protein [Motilimonas cestriensis]MCE2595694.1 hypothetical protein [Motilimonas cestriensis]